MKTLSLISLLTFTLLTFTTTTSVWSQPIMFLQDGPVRYFNDDDMALFKQTLDSALENQPDNESLSWINKKTQSQGTVTPLSSEEQDGMLCRLTQMSNTAKGLTRQAELTLCRQEDGRWLFAE